MTTTLRRYVRFGGVALQASPGLSALTGVAMLITALAPLAAVAVIGAVVESAAGGIGGAGASGARSDNWSETSGWAVLAGGVFLLQWAARAIQTAAALSLGERIDALLQRDLMRGVMAPAGIAHLEDATTLNLVNVGRETFGAPFSRPGRMVSHLSGLAAGRLLLAGSSLMVAHFNLVLGVALAATAVWAAYEEKSASHREASHHQGNTEVARRTDYYFQLGVTPPAAKETRVFGLADLLTERFLGAWRASMADVFAPASPRPLLAAAALGAVVLAGVVMLARAAIAGDIAPGPAVVYAQALIVAIGAVGTSSNASLQTELSLTTLDRYDRALDAVANASDGQPRGGHPLPGADSPSRAIHLDGVSFSYPGTRGDVLRELDLVIPAGRSLAIVGANGAGKTTIVKLLCGLYAPTAGRITVDATDLAEIDLAQWRRRIAAVFQDSVRFELPARVNVGLGRVDEIGDTEGIAAAGAQAGIGSVITLLPKGWDTPLSPEYAGGADLSGGEWQKLGLARALFAVRHGASVLILDEPAAHLDARAEAELYARFLAMTEGTTTIVISHRFSTVRQASSIVVIDDGQVAEQGSHDELLARGGLYAEMFRLQASRFAGAGTVEVADTWAG